MLDLDNSYATDLDEEFWISWEGAPVPDPRVLLVNRDLAREVAVDADALASTEGAELLAGMRAPEGATPVAQAYAGHQFGGFSPRLGDGRALLLGELTDAEGRRRDLHLKGSGATPFSRGGDGKAVLGPVLREYIVGEAMYALGIPTTRALAALVTGERILRQGGLKPGAILARVAASHLRIGTFQYFAARGDHDRVRQLLEYALRRHDPELLDSDDRALALLAAVADRQARLVARWMGVGFIHGVMNTDNTSISGETIDYGPCAFMESYDPATVFSSIDRHGRYAYGQQPAILQWNLARFAEALLPVMDVADRDEAVALATHEVNRFGPVFQAEWATVFRAKLGVEEAQDGDTDLVSDLLDLMAKRRVDFTRGFRSLSGVLRGEAGGARRLFAGDEAFDAWVERWRARLRTEGIALSGQDREGAEGPARSAAARADAMDRVNPVYIPRNHLVEQALTAAEEELDLGPTERLLKVLGDPFAERGGLERYAEPAPEDFGPYVTFCGT